MDKVLAKLVVEAHGIKTPKMQFALKSDYSRRPASFVKAIEDSLTYPLFVKPAHLGSSIGIAQVRGRKELENALEVAFHYDQKVLVEEAVPNLIELTLPIMGNDQPKPALLERPLTQPEDFFDFDTKYMFGGKKGGGKKGGAKGSQGYSELPAKLDDALYKKVEQIGLDVYRALGCGGTARIDLFVDSKTKDVFFIEANPLPGSIYSHNWRAAGVSNVELVQSLIHLAEERWQQEQRQNTVFSTNYLQQF